MNYNVLDTKTDMTPSIPVERESLKALITMTNERLNEAVFRAEAILGSIRGAFPTSENALDSPSCMMDAERINTELSGRLCMTLVEIAKQLGGEA